MKTTILLIGIILASIGTSNFGLKETAKKCSAQDPNSKISWTTAMQGYLTNSSMRINEDLYFFIGQTNWRTIKTNQLKNATLISDIIDNYPHSWITNYHGVIISSDEKTALGKNFQLTGEQKKLLSNLTANKALKIEINYDFKNSVTNKLEKNSMVINMIVEPEVAAQQTENYEALIKKTKQSFIEQMNALGITWMNGASVHFIINKAGKPEQIQVKTSTGNHKIDNVLVDLVKGLPGWEPAKDINNNPTEQAAVFSVGMNGC